MKEMLEADLKRKLLNNRPSSGKLSSSPSKLKLFWLTKIRGKRILHIGDEFWYIPNKWI